MTHKYRALYVPKKVCCPRCEGAGWNHRRATSVSRGFYQQRQRLECELCDGKRRVDKPTHDAWVSEYIEKQNRIDFHG